MKRILKHLLWIIPLIIVIVVISLVAYAATARRSDIRYHSTLQKTLHVSSNSFQNEQEMPVDLSCRAEQWPLIFNGQARLPERNPMLLSPWIGTRRRRA